MAADYPAWSDYNYVLDNPIMFIDPDGRNAIRKEDPEAFLASPIEQDETQANYPSSEELKETFAPDAIEKIFSLTSGETFADDFNITPDQRGVERLSQVIIGTEIAESPQADRPSYRGVVTQVITEIGDSNAITDNNPYGLPDADKVRGNFSLNPEIIPENTSAVISTGISANELSVVIFPNSDKIIVFAVVVTIIEDI